MTLADVRRGLRAYLLADNAIAALVGVRVYALKLPQGENRTSIVYSRISGLGDYHMQGPSGLSRPRVQIDCWAADIDQASVLADLVKERIEGFRGQMDYGSDSPPDAIAVQGIFFDSEREDYDDTVKLSRVSRDYFIWFAER